VRHERPEIPIDCVPSLRALIESCWQPDPSKRPSFKDIITQLDNVIVDCAIRDEKGRQFWKTHFLKKEEVAWMDYVAPFAQFVTLSDNETKDINIKCLHAILGIDSVFFDFV